MSALSLALLALVSVGQGAVAVEVAPAQGVETIIAVADEAGNARGGETVRVIHRPGLAGEQELAIGITDGRGRVRWIPETAGIAVVRAGDETLRVRVTPSNPPTSTLVLLGVLLAVGAGAVAYGTLGRAS